MSWEPDRYRLWSWVWWGSFVGEEERQRSRPEIGDESRIDVRDFVVRRGETLEHFQAGYVHDQRVIRGSTFERVDSTAGLWGHGGCAQAVHRLGRDGDQSRGVEVRRSCLEVRQSFRRDERGVETR